MASNQRIHLQVRETTNATTMQTARESSRQRRCNKRRNSRKKSLSPSDLKCVRDSKADSKLTKRSLSESSVKVKHRKSNIRRTLTHPFTCVDDISVGVFNSEVKVPESDESNLPPTSSDRDTEDDGRIVPMPLPIRPRWDSGSEMDSLVSTVVRRAARRRRTPVNSEWGVNYETGEASEPEAGRMRPEDYRLVFLSSDSSCREDTEDSSSTASSAAPPAPDDCDWDYFEPGAAAPNPTPPPVKLISPTCPRACSCGAEPRIVAVPVPVPVPVPAALWPALLAFPSQPPPPSWNTYPGFPPLDAAALARLTTAAAVAVTAAATASASINRLDMTTVQRTDKAIQSESPQRSELRDSDNDNDIEPIKLEASVDIKVIAEKDRLSVLSERVDAMPEHLDAEKAFPSSNESGDSSDSEAGVARRSYDLTSGAPEEPATSDEDSDDSGGGGGGSFSRVFVVNPADSSSDLEDNADSSGIDCDDSYDKKSDSLEIIAVGAEMPIDNNDVIDSNESCSSQNCENSNIVLVDSVSFTEEYPVTQYKNHNEAFFAEGNSSKSQLSDFCDRNMLQSETCETFNSFNATCSSSVDDFDNTNNSDNGHYRYRSISESTDSNLSATNYSTESEIKVKVSFEVPNEKHNNANIISTEISPESFRKLSTSPEPSHESSSPSTEQIDLFKGIERTLSELLKKELLEDQGEEKMHDNKPVCTETEGGASAPAATTVCRPRTARADGSARFTSRVMITHDRVSVVTSDTTRLMRDITVQHTNSQNEQEHQTSSTRNETDERLSDDETSQPSGGVTVVSNADTLSAVVCLEEGLADDDSWVEDVSHDDEDDATSPSDTDSGDEASLPTRGEEFAYCRRSIDFTLHTIVEESCEESETEQTKKPRPISATELEKYFFFGLGEGRNFHDDEEAVSDTSSVCSEGAESIVDSEQPKRNSSDNDELSSRLETYFLKGFMGFNQEKRDSDGSGSVGSDSEGRQSPEQRRKRLVRARGTPRSHSNSLDNLLTGDEPSQDTQEVSDGSSTETEENRLDSSERLDSQGENKRKKQNKKTRGSPADERRQSAEFTEEARDDARSVSEGEDGRISPRPEFPLLGSELSESKKQTSRDSGFVGSCDDLLRNGDSSNEFSRSHEPKIELEEITEEIRPEVEERVEGPVLSRPPQSPLSRKDSFNNWSSDEETNLMMTKMRQFFKQMVNTTNVRTSTPALSNSESSRPPKPPQLLYFESELTRLMKTVPGIRDEEVREIVEYLSSEDTWSDSYDSSDYAGSDLEGTTSSRSVLRKQISESCREIIDKFDNGNNDAGSLERDAVGAYRMLTATLERAGEGSPPLFGKVMRHIGGRLVALMHEVSAGASPSTDDDSASEPGALARSRSHDILEATASRGSVVSDCERFSWRGSFESALLAADSRGTLGGGVEARRSPAGVELAAQRSHSRSCGAISGSEDRLWRGRRRASAPDAEPEEEQRSGSLPRLPSIAASTAPAAGPVKSARYRAPGFRTATRAASAPGLHAPRRRRPPPTPQQPPPSAPASAPSLQDEVYLSDNNLSPGHATLPRRSNSPLPHERDLDRDRFIGNRSGLQARSESMASVYSGAGEGTRASVTVRGEIQFSLLYNYRLGALEVGIKRCRDLAPVDVKRNRSDPYVKMYLLPDKSKTGKRKTKVKKNTLNPVFEETLSFVQPLASLSARTLWLSVWHADMFGRNDFLGEVTLPLGDVVFDDPAPMWYKLHERTEQFDDQQVTRGDLIIGLKFELHDTGAMRGKGTLHVLVKEAKNLVATKPSGLADVFCKSYLLPERGRLAKQKTNVVRRSLNPRWEHTFTYRGLKLQELSTRALELSLWDRDRLGSNDFMGAIRLSLGTGTYMGANVNWMDSVGKEVSLWQTMMQRPNFWVEGSLPLRPQLNN